MRVDGQVWEGAASNQRFSGRALKVKRSKTTSSENEPRSTKSPLKRYGFFSDGYPAAVAGMLERKEMARKEM